MAGLYIHIPFCLRKCGYCDFYSETTLQRIPEFLVAIFQELACYAADARFTAFDTIYLGGGTPSLLTTTQIRSIIIKAGECFTINPDAEISIEVNPSAIEMNLEDLKHIGINRLSIGVQSLNDEELRLLARLHTASEARHAIHRAKSVFKNTNVDLIYGLPGQSVDQWMETVREIINLAPQHISAYTLTWSEHTPIGRRILQGELPHPDEEILADMYFAAHESFTRAGYEHYEVSNYAKPGYRCRHNDGYWTGKPYLGLGPSAHSFVDNERFWNVKSIQQYATVLSQQLLPKEGSEHLTEKQRQTEHIALGLRHSEGCIAPHIDKELMASLENRGLAMRSQGRVQPTTQGMLLADEIALSLMA